MQVTTKLAELAELAELAKLAELTELMLSQTLHPLPLLLSVSVDADRRKWLTQVTDAGDGADRATMLSSVSVEGN